MQQLIRLFICDVKKLGELSFKVLTGLFKGTIFIPCRVSQRNCGGLQYRCWNALMINDTAFLRNPNYHLKSDTIETLDFKKMTGVINSAYKAITKII